MKEKAAREVSFVELCIEERRAKLSDHFLYKIKECVDWERLRKTIRKGYKKNKNATGNPAYDPIVLFKILLLEKWYKLSDYQAEERINDSFLFSDFIDIALSAPAPDHSTICRFRNELTKLNLMDELLDTFNTQLVELGILQIKEGALVDATIVSSPRKPHRPKVLEIAADREDARSEAQKQEEEDFHQKLRYTEPGIDHQARFVKKGNKYYWGYKHHVCTDKRGLVVKLNTTPANRSDTHELPKLLEGALLPEHTRVFADKGYDSAANRSCLKDLKLRDGIMRRKLKGKEFSERERVRNRAISKRRCFVEHAFGGIHLWFGGGIARYVGVERTHTQGILEALAYNMKRMLRIPLSS